MNWIEVQAGRAQELEAAPSALPADGYVWLDLLHEDAAADPEFLPGTVERLAGVRLFDLHLQDAMNPQHPSFFDSTNDYQMLVFRKLSTGDAPPLEEKRATAADQRRLLQEIVTRPITFFLLDRMLVTVRQGPSKSIDAVRQRMLDARRYGNDPSIGDRSRLPLRAGELMLRMLIVGYCFGIRSERRLCEEVHLNLAYRWFCRLGLEDAVQLVPVAHREGLDAAT